jgi:RimJ/RimL family protein N-acetyltransferase
MGGVPDDRAPLRTQRLDLEPLRVEHAEEMAAVLADERLYVFIGGSPPTMADLRERYRRQVVGRSADGAQRWFNWILRRRQDHQVVGFVQATTAHGPDGLAAELAWVVGTGYQGHGYAAEAVRAMVGRLRELGVANVLAHIHPGHVASERVARAADLVPTATMTDGEVRWQSRTLSAGRQVTDVPGRGGRRA